MSWVRSLLRKKSQDLNTVTQKGLDAKWTAERLGRVQSLRNVFQQFVQATEATAKEEKFAELLSSFWEAFGESSVEEVQERFGDVFSFAYHISRYVVIEVKKRGNHPSREEASLSILDYFRETSVGGEVFRVLFLLARGEDNVVEEMARAGLPSTLCKCFYVFVTLPAPSDDDVAKETAIRMKLQGRMVRVLGRLGQRKPGVEEMLRTGDISFLFRIITIPLERHNYVWRTGAMEVLVAMFGPHLRRELVLHTHEKQYMRRIVGSFKKAQLALQERVEVLKALLQIIKASLQQGEQLIADFADSGGYRILAETLLALDSRSSEPPSEKDLAMLNELFKAIVELIYAGRSDPLANVSPMQNQDPNFRVPRPSSSGRCIRNVSVFFVLQSVYADADGEWLRNRLLDEIQNIFTADPANYFILEKYHLLVDVIKTMNRLTNSGKDKVLRMLDYVVCSLNYVPFNELRDLVAIFKEPNDHMYTACLKMLAKFCTFDIKYTTVLREVGFLDQLLVFLTAYEAQLGRPLSETNDSSVLPRQLLTREAVHALLDALSVLLVENDKNLTIFRERRLHKTLLTMIRYPTSQSSALKLCTQLVTQGTLLAQTMLAGMLGLLEDTNTAAALRLSCQVLSKLERTVATSAVAKGTFREVGGFVDMVRLLVRMKGRLQSVAGTAADHEMQAEWLKVFGLALALLAAAMDGDPVNKEYMKTEIRYSSLADTIRGTGVLGSIDANRAVDRLLGMAFECGSQQQSLLVTAASGMVPVINNGEVMAVLIHTLPSAPSPLQKTVFTVLRRLTTLECNQQTLAAARIGEDLVEVYGAQLLEEADKPSDLQLAFEAIVAQRFSARLLKSFFKKYQAVKAQGKSAAYLLEMLVRMTHRFPMPVPDFIEFDMQKKGYACLALPLNRNRPWPPPTAYTFACWIMIDRWDPREAEHPVRLLTATSNDQFYLQAYISPADGCLYVRTGTEGSVRFDGQHFAPGRWYHVVLLHSRHRLRSDTIVLFVDGISVQAQKLPYALSGTAGDSADTLLFVGTAHHDRKVTSLVWRMGPCYFLDEAVPAQMATIMFFVGPKYSGNFQGAMRNFQTYEVMSSDMLSAFNTHDLSLFNLSMANYGGLLPTEDHVVASLHARNLLPYSTPVRGALGLTDQAQKAMALVVGTNMRYHKHLRNGTDATGQAPAEIPATLSGDFRVFCPVSVGDGVRYIGGFSGAMYLVHEATTPQELQAGLALFVQAIKFNAYMTLSMEWQMGYQMLSLLLRRKGKILTTDMVDTIYHLIGCPANHKEEQVLANSTAFRHLVLDYDMWRQAHPKVQRHVYRRLYELLDRSSHTTYNLKRLRRLGMVQRLLYVLRDESVPQRVAGDIVGVITKVLDTDLIDEELERLARFVVYTLHPDAKEGDRGVTYVEGMDTTVPGHRGLYNPQKPVTGRKILVRNMLLEALVTVLDRRGKLAAESIVRSSGMQWIMLFIGPELQQKTVLLAMRILVAVVVHSKTSASVMQQLNGNGFAKLEESLKAHARCEQLYFLCLALLFGHHVGHIPFGLSLDLAALTNIFVAPPPEKLSIYCVQAMPIILAMLRSVHEAWLLACLHDGRDTSSLDNLEPTDRRDSTHSLDAATGSTLSRTSSMRSRDSVSFDEENTGPGPRKRQGSTSEFEIPADNKEQLQRLTVTMVKYLFSLYRSMRSDLFWQSNTLEDLVAILFPACLVVGPERLADMGLADPESLEDISRDSLPAPMESVKKVASWLAGLEEPRSSKDDGRLNGIPTIDEYQRPGNVEAYKKLVAEGLDAKLLLDNAVADVVLQFLVTIVTDSFTLDTKIKDYRDRYPVILNAMLEAPPPVHTELLSGYQSRVFVCLSDHLLGMDRERFVEMYIQMPATFASMARAAELMADCVIGGHYVLDPMKVVELLVTILANCHEKGDRQIRDQLFTSLNDVVMHELTAATAGWQGAAAFVSAIINSQLVVDTILSDYNNTDSKFLRGFSHILVKLMTWEECQARTEAMTLWKLLLLSKPDDMRENTKYRGQLGEEIELYDEIFEIILSSNAVEFTRWMKEKEIVRDALAKNGLSEWQDYRQFREEAQRASQQERAIATAQRLSSRARDLTRLAKILARDESELENLRTNVTQYENNMFVKQRQNWLDTQNYFAIKANRMLKDLTHERGLMGPDEEKEAKWMLDVIEGPFRMRKRLCRNYNFHRTYAELLSDGAYPLLLQDGETRPTRSGEGPGDVRQGDQLSQEKAALKSSQRRLSKELKALASMGTLGALSASSREIEERKEAMQSGNPEENAAEIVAESGTQIPTTPASAEAPPSTTATPTNEEPPPAPAVTGSENRGEGEDGPLPGIGGERADEFGSQEEDVTIIQMLEPGDRIKHAYSASRIQGLDVTDCLLLLCEKNLYIIDGYCVVTNPVTLRQEIVEIAATMQDGTYAPIVPAIADNLGQGARSEGETAKRKRTQQAGDDSFIIRCGYERITEIHKHRYLLREVAVEIFSDDGRDTLLAFAKPDRDLVYNKLIQATAGLRKNENPAKGTSSGIEIETGGFFSALRGEKSYTQRWVNGEVTNFQYLMWVNTVAGRSCNDLTQYPVFPWILADYSSEELDLNNPETFRDLSKPMGNQSPKRAQIYLQRYHSWEDPTLETPAFHYGTHYSSAMIVASYMIRMEPFTQMFLTLQGGHFDHPDRMFDSIQEAWESAAIHNTADVKELIPEFFYLPEFLLNSNHFDFGRKQTGQQLDDVGLPPWAKGSVYEFIRVHREALECEYVSRNLHKWIDLVFGCKQQGEEARKAMNVFHHLSYEGAVDIDKITDPVQRQAVIGIINNFGQTPRQVFKKPHPARRVIPTALQRARVLYTCPEQLKVAPEFAKDIKVPVGQIVVVDRQIYALGRYQVLWPSPSSRVAWDNADNSVRVISAETQKPLYTMENMHMGPIRCLTFCDESTMVTGGSDSIVCVWSLERKGDSKGRGQLRAGELTHKLVKTMHGHTSPVTALATSRPFSIIVSGSLDTTCIIWDLNQLEYIRSLRGHPSPIVTVAINDRSGDIITCSDFVLRVWSLNGNPIATHSLSGTLASNILCCTMSEDCEWEKQNIIITGHKDGVAKIWRAVLNRPTDDDEVEEGTDPGQWSTELVCVAELTKHTAFSRQDNPQPAAITCMTITKDHRTLLVGDDRGRVMTWSIPDTPGPAAENAVNISNKGAICSSCKVKFGRSHPRHSCRNCNDLFCGPCTDNESIIPRLHIYTPVRVCQNCYRTLSTKWHFIASPTMGRSAASRTLSTLSSF